ncbi:MAG: 50S ribosomal protein L11 methyltransferase [Dehalococcoidia bacterium]|nr:MAG: 50S ribosomal protein L11 methyltransferase [Dehalococcoidia bacterium]
MPPRKQSPARWLELSVEVAPDAEEAVSDVLRRHAHRGVSVEPAAASVVVKAYLPADGDLARRRRALRRQLAALALPSALRTRWLSEEDWTHAWKEFFPVLRVSPRLVVCPTWRSYRPRHGESVIRLDPGMAFGTGQHPTTLMCLRALEELLRPRMTVLDLGTGSAILALAAARLGAASVLALDIDPQAIAVAQENVRLNDLDALVQVEQGGLDQAPTAAFDLAMAKISAAVIAELASALGQALRPGGVLIVAGFSAESEERVSSALARTGLLMERSLADGDWRAHVARRP